MSKYPPQSLLHQPVLLDETLRLLRPQKGESYLDLTVGYGGHAAAIIANTKAAHAATLVDRDAEAINQLELTKKLEGARLLRQDFKSAALDLVKDTQQFDIVVVDLGVSSPQLDESARGFSFRLEARPDMRMDQRQTKTAWEVVNTALESELSSLIRRYGQESPGNSRRIARAIIEARPIESTTQLGQVIKHSYRGRYSRIHPATRTFQALRIAVNDELAQLEALLPLLPRLLTANGRVGIISFHSLEDAMVKRFFQTEASSGYEATLTLLNKKPIAGATHDVHNPRARSSKLRGAAKINTNRKDLSNAN